MGKPMHYFTYSILLLIFAMICLMSVPAQGPITIYTPAPISMVGSPPPGHRFKFRVRIKTVLSALAVFGIVSGFYPLVGEVRGVLTQGGSAVTLDKVLDENFNFSLAGNLEGSQLISTTTDSDPLVVNSTGLVDNLNADLLDGQSGSYYIDTFPATGWTDTGSIVRLVTSTDLVGIGTTAPEEPLHVFRSVTTGTDSLVKSGLFDLFLYADDATPGTNIYMGVQGRARYYGVSGETAYAVTGVRGSFLNMSSGDVTEAVGVYTTVGNNSTGTIDRAIGFYNPGIANLSTGTINEAYGLLVGSLINSGGGVITDNYGVYISNQSCAGCTNTWAVYAESGDSYLNGNLTIGENLKTTANATNALNLLNNGVSLESYFSIQMNLDNDADDSGEQFKVVTDGGATSLFVINDDATVGIGTDTPDEGQVEVKGGTVCIDDDSDDSATSCIASESDARLKTNVTPIEGALDKLLSIRGVEFDWKWNDPEILAQYPLISRFESQPHSLGVIAQEVATVFPEVIMAEKAGGEFLQVDYSRLVPPIIEAIKELSAKVSDLSVNESGDLTSSGDLVIPAKLETTEGVFEKLTATVLGTFESLIVKTAEIASAVVENLRVKFLTIGESSAPTGITIYDRANGEPYCVAVNEGTVVTAAGICE